MTLQEGQVQGARSVHREAYYMYATAMARRSATPKLAFLQRHQRLSMA
jgi:hypothetical protein